MTSIAIKASTISNTLNTFSEPSEVDSLAIVRSTYAKQRAEATPGVALKFDAGKTDYSLMPLDLLDGVARVFAIGEQKYAADNFRTNGGLDPRRTLAAAMRHLAVMQRVILTGDQKDLADADSGEAHIHHAICSLLMCVDGLRQRGFKV
jgi:hypothetical protein